MTIVNFLFPKKCLGCNKEGSYICSSCILRVSKPKPTCVECGRPSVDGFTHFKCQKKLGLNGKLSIWNYEGVVRKAISALKYKYATEVGKELLIHLLKEVETTVLAFSKDVVVVPVPLHWYRENSRGFNQSDFLGKEVSDFFGWRFGPNLLIRKRFSNPQVVLSREERIKNIRGVFSLNREKGLHMSSYLIFDDVYTTGSTLKEACKVLKRNGINKVFGLTVAR